MPAREPGATPHLPTTLSSTPAASIGPVLPTYHHGGTTRSASSSAFTRAADTSPHGGVRRRVSTGDGFVGKMLRRLSVVSTGEHDLDFDESHAGHHDDLGDSAFAPTDEDYDESILGSSHTSRAIRDSTNRLASMSFTGRSIAAAAGQSGFSIDHRPHVPSPLTSTAGAVDLSSSPRVPISPHTPSGPSGLSMLMERGRQRITTHGSGSTEGGGYGGETPRQGMVTLVDELLPPHLQPHPGRSTIHLESTLDEVIEEDEDMGSSSEFRQYLERESTIPSERTPLLGGLHGGAKRAWASRAAIDFEAARTRLGKVTAQDVFHACVTEPIQCLPAVSLGLLLNVLDGVSYGMIIFPASDDFPDFGSIGVAMFFMSCIISQLVFSFGGSIFKGGNGSMQIESVPFLHIITSIIQAELGSDTQAIVATTMVAFAFGSILCGLVFFILGTFKLGSLIGYFPRHILVGCIGGVGVFLFVTGLQVSLGLDENSFDYNFKTLKHFFQDLHHIVLWGIPLVLAIILRVITHTWHNQLIFPLYFFFIPVVFYIVVLIGGWDMATLRENGWVFDVGSSTEPWWAYTTKFSWRHTNWSVFWKTMPTQFALVFFGILHVPLNVPALGVSLAEDNVRLDRELLAHGASNTLSGLLGTVPNYLTYVNTVLFYRVGGGSALSGFLLAAATFGVMCVGPTVIASLPIMVVGALIFVLGLDLIIESVWDTRNRVNRFEYFTIITIMACMTLFDFVTGLLIGVILACIFFVIQSSRRRPIRAIFTGYTAKSTVRRPRQQRAFIQRVGSQTMVMKLHGFLFFGTISVVEDEIRKLLEVAHFDHHPIRFLIIDFALVGGLDFSSAEAFVRIQRLLAAKQVLLVMCGADPYSPVGTALRAVDLWADQEGTRVEVFATLNDALEWTENAYLTAFYENQMQRTKSDSEQPRTIDLPKINRMPFSLAESFQNSPRRTTLARAGDDTLPVPYVHRDEPTTAPPSEMLQPMPILMQIFESYSNEEDAFFRELAPYFKQVVAHAGDVLWHQGDNADGLYLIEAGSLRATYSYDEHSEAIQETMVAGTVAGDLSTLSDTLRNATVVAERECVLWKLEPESLAHMEKDKPEVAGRFIKLVLKAAVEEVDVLASHLVAVLS